MRKKLLITILILILGILLQLLINKPDSRFSSQPAGWPGKYTDDSLSGLISKFNQDMIPAYLATTDNARILAYASMAYNKAKYSENGTEKNGKNAFFMVISDITDNMKVNEMYKSDKNDTIAKKAFIYAKNIYNKDLYKYIFDKEIDISKDYFNNTKREFYLYKPPLGHNSELEKGWGLLKTIGSHDCKLPPPPVSSLIELVAEAAKVDNIMGNFQKIDKEKYSKILFLITHYTGAPAHRNEPARLLSQIILNIAHDSNLSKKDKDYYIMESLIGIHNAQIISWYYKYFYKLIHPISLLPSRQITNALPNGPSYPSEFSTIASTLNFIYKKYNIDTPVRLEIKGSLTTMPSTRVYKDFYDFSREFSEVPVFVGYNYLFDLKAGEDLGLCVGGIKNES
jgi:hypothetical protein